MPELCNNHQEHFDSFYIVLIDISHCDIVLEQSFMNQFSTYTLENLFNFKPSLVQISLDELELNGHTLKTLNYQYVIHLTLAFL